MAQRGDHWQERVIRRAGEPNGASMSLHFHPEKEGGVPFYRELRDEGLPFELQDILV